MLALGFKKPLSASAKRRLLLRFIVIGVGVGLIGYGIFGFLQRHQATHRPEPLPTATVTNSVAAPNETPINPHSDYKVPADQPRRIILPTIAVEGFVQRVGVDQHGAIAVPSNINAAGWFVDNAIPGSKGVSIIDGHVQGKYAPGIFKKLSQLKAGNKFTVEYGDRSTKTFEVVSVTSYPVKDVGPYLFKQHDDISAQLNLITCGGTYNVANQGYDQRVLVVSKLVSS